MYYFNIFTRMLCVPDSKPTKSTHTRTRTRTHTHAHTHTHTHMGLSLGIRHISPPPAKYLHVLSKKSLCLVNWAKEHGLDEATTGWNRNTFNLLNNMVSFHQGRT